jgi:stearoyl-CoA desaturase (delta-9 desaturase)
MPTAILLFFVGHWCLAVMFQSFFQHRYAAHRMFTMSRGWERFFYLTTYLVQGSSFLNPGAYAVLHRMHHAYSDTPKDPHSPRNHSGLLGMMWATKKRYHDLAHGIVAPEPKFAGGVPRWRFIDKIGGSWPIRIVWGTLYGLFYIRFATHAWQFALVPVHWVLGPTHGAIVNWCGHRYGYRNFESRDDSRNTLPLDFVTLGELFQNNHHRHGQRANFAVKWFELDPTYQFIRVLAWLRIIRLAEDRAPERTPLLAEPEGV